jgi:hypothetical protein
VPPKNVAGLLNNESNLRILEKLKSRAYYPRELSAEMKLSESFIVRRLKAMEEFDIVEGRWESEGTRKVKRYYLKDVTMQLGKGGLEVTSGEVMLASPPKTNITPEKELLKLTIWLPILLLIFGGIYLNDPLLIAIVALLFAWMTAINVVLYRHLKYKSMISAILLLIMGVLSIANVAWIMYGGNNLLKGSSEFYGYFYMIYGIVFFALLVYHVRYSQIELVEMTRDRQDFIADLESASVPVKLFYLPMALRWKINEYFGLV